jgi:outer membrane murein-binding lipoprotein Lpp
MTFAEIIERAAGLFYGWTSEKAADGEITLTELDQLDGELDEIKTAIEQQRALILAALEDAGGADARADKNKSQKV